MSKEAKTLVVLGGSGFIGQYVIREAIAAGWQVRALARSEEFAGSVRAVGGWAILGDAARPDHWISDVAGASAIIDLIQPRFPKRLGLRQTIRIGAERQALTISLVAALQSLARDKRPVFIAVSGIDDLLPDKSGAISGVSPQRTFHHGFSPIGVPVRRVIEQSKLEATFVYLGTVYGPGKAFASTIFPSVAAGKWKNFGSATSHMSLIHVEDAARALVRIATLGQSQMVGRSIVVTDKCPVSMKLFFGFAARLMGVKEPGRVPQWVASLVAGQSLIETMIGEVGVKSSSFGSTEFQLKYPSYIEGLPATLDALGYLGKHAA
jgi:nucleoside-diphosphate-sugar epimerase